MTVEKELRLEAKARLLLMKKKLYLAFFAELLLIILPVPATFLLVRSGFSAFETLKPGLAFGLSALLSAVLFLVFRAFNVRLFLSAGGKVKRAVPLFRAVLFEALLLIIKAVIFLFCLLPFSAMLLCAGKAAVEQTPLCAVSVMWAFSVSLFVLGVFFFRRFSALLFPAGYIYNTRGKMFQSIKLSIKRSDESAASLLRLRRSFSPWFFLCVFVVPSAYVWSYYGLSAAALAKRFV